MVSRTFGIVVVATTLVTLALPNPWANALRAAERSRDDAYDVVVYGGTSAGVIAAIRVAEEGKSVVVVEPSRHVGGLTTGGLGATDIGNKGAIGGLSREFYRRVGRHYADDDAWKFQSPDDYVSRRQSRGEEEMWTFEPHVAERILLDWIEEAGVPVLYEQRLDLQSGVEMDAGRIVAIRLESGLHLAGRVFIDATYEGDLMAVAGVSYHVGRESNDTYGETLNGVQVRNAVSHQFIKSVDPYVRPGDPSSGLLPGVHGDDPGRDGEGDHRVQAYCYRLCTTDVPQNRRPWPKPEGYDPLRYELLLRNFEAGDHRVPWNPVWLPNRKTDTNNNYAFSTDNIGMNYDYPDGDYATRAEIIAEHVRYQQGLMWTLANDPRVPSEVQEHFRRLGLARDEFVDNDNWPHQLYVREARRMISDYVMTQHDCQGRRIVDDAVGLAAYTMDSHNVQRYARDGRVWNEGDVQVGGFHPYPIAYRSIVPRAEECSNLLVPVCLSASHIAYGSIRMEPVFMVLGHSAAAAACLAIEGGTDVQEVSIARLQDVLRKEGQVLQWTGPKRKPPIEAASLPGVVVDDADAELIGLWGGSAAIPGYVGYRYRHDGDEQKGDLRAIFRPNLNEAGTYEVRIAYSANPNRATNVPIAIVAADGTHHATVNQRQKPEDGVFQSVGRYRFGAGDRGCVIISNEDTDGYVIVDAVQFLPVDARQ